jgi:hypothetical protein
VQAAVEYLRQPSGVRLDGGTIDAQWIVATPGRGGAGGIEAEPDEHIVADWLREKRQPLAPVRQDRLSAEMADCRKMVSAGRRKV